MNWLISCDALGLRVRSQPMAMNPTEMAARIARGLLSFPAN